MLLRGLQYSCLYLTPFPRHYPRHSIHDGLVGLNNAYIESKQWKFTISYLSVTSAVAQRVERWTCDQQVVGSNPTRGKAV